jgi:hypothetical protein
MPVPVDKKRQPVEVELTDAQMRPEAPIIRCRIVYRGANKNRSVALPGQIQIAKMQVGFDEKNEPIFEEMKSAISEGMQNYDFASHDSMGKLITQRMCPAEVGAELAGKPFAFCEHIDHIRWFYLQRMADGSREFSVLASREDQPIIQDAVRRFNRAAQEQDNMFETTVRG